MSFLQIEIYAAQCLLSVEDFTFSLWIYLLNKKNKKDLNKLAKELNVFPKPANVYGAITEKLFEGIAIY